MSLVSGTVGAVMGSEAQTDAANTQAAATRYATDANLKLQKEMYDQQRADFEPFLGLGTAAVKDMDSFDLMAGLGSAPNYDELVTDQLSNYEEDPATAAMKSLGADRLARERAARVGYSSPGADANAQSELGMKYDITGYDKYKQELSDRYKAKQGEFSQRRDINQNKYNQILDKIKVGQGAASSTGQASNTYAGNAGNAFNQLGAGLSTAAGNAGAAQAGLWSGLGAQSASAASTGLKAWDTGQRAGLWGNAAGAATTWGASGGAVGAGGEALSAEGFASFI